MTRAGTMTRLGYHMRFHLIDDGVIASTIGERRILARAILEQGRHFDLYAFGYPDTHVHLAARVDRAGAGRLTHAVEVSLRRRLGLTVGFMQYPPKPLVDNQHLYSTVRYILRQADRHGVEGDPRCEGSSLPDLLGLRLLGAYTAQNVRRWLPRLRQPELLECLAVTEFAPADGQVEQVLPAALAAGCVADLRGRAAETVALRRAVVEVLGDRLRTPEVANMLGLSSRGVQLLRKKPVRSELVLAIRLQLGVQLPWP